MCAETYGDTKWAFAIVSLGANLGEPLKNIEKALSAFNATPGIRVLRHSSFYTTYPVGTSFDKPLYVNAVAALETRLSPLNLLAALQEIETNLGRVRTGFWSDRTIDLDVLLYEDVTMETEEMTLPHKRLQWRDFVLTPACEIVPNLKTPIFGWTFRQLKTLLDWNFRDFRIVTGIISDLATKGEVQRRIS